MLISGKIEQQSDEHIDRQVQIDKEYMPDLDEWIKCSHVWRHVSHEWQFRSHVALKF